MYVLRQGLPLCRDNDNPGALANAVHSVGVNYGVKNSVHRLTHCPSKLTVLLCLAFSVIYEDVVSNAVRNIVTRKNATCQAHVPGSEPVGYRVAFHTRFVSQPFGHKALVVTRPNRTDTVEGGHNAHCIAIANCKHEGSQIVLTHGLLVEICSYLVTVGLLLVENEVLVINVASLGPNTSALRTGDYTCEESILAVILEVSAVIGISVNIKTYTVNTGAARPQAILTDCSTAKVCKLGVEGG